MTKLKGGQKWADEIAIPTKQAFCTLQEEQSLCFLKALQNIHVGQPRITFPSPFVWQAWDGQLSPTLNL